MNNKKKILFLSPYPYGIGPSQRFRFEQYFDYLSLSFHITQKTFWNKQSWDILFSQSNAIIKFWYLLWAFAKRKIVLLSIYKYDAVFIHREVAHIGPPIFEWFIKYIFRKPIIYDFDDAIWHLNYSDKNKIARYFKSPWKVKYICRWADVVITGNSFLQNYAQKHNRNVVVIPTTIDTSHHRSCTRKSDAKITIGWTGTLTTLKQLEPILPVIEKLQLKYDIDFLIISNEQPQFKIKNQSFIKWNPETEIQDLCKIDIGIMPLYDTEWEKGKCGLKGLQYMALEIPSIMSPVGVNTEIIQDGKNGLLAETEQEWFDKLSLLIENKELRQQLGKAGRQTVLKQYSVEVNKQKYLDALSVVV